MPKVQLPLLVALILIVPACGGNISVPAPLLTDTFSSPFPDSSWGAAVLTGSGTAPVTTGGVLTFTASAQPSSSTTMTTSSFTNPSVTFNVQMGAQSASQPGIGTIELVNGSNAVVAFVSWDVGTGMITYSINGTAIAPQLAPSPLGTLTGFSFSVNSSGNATWSHNNVSVATNSAFPAGPLSLRLGATWSSGVAPFATFSFDNASVTSP